MSKDIFTDQFNKEFSTLNKELPEIHLRMDYAIKDNFTGDIVKGYYDKIAFLTKPAIKSLAKAMEEFKKDDFQIIIFDTYRPMQAVKYFYQEWAKKPIDKELKQKYFPKLSKADLFEIGYLSKKSSHCRGSTIDMGLINKEGHLVDFGTCFDFFGEESHTNFEKLKKEVKENRKYFVEIMQRNGFKNYSKEWWHFNLTNEPFPETYFDFKVEDQNE